MSVLRKYITPNVLNEDYKFVPNSGVYYSPPPGGLEQYRQGILLQPELQRVCLLLACTGRASRDQVQIGTDEAGFCISCSASHRWSHVVVQHAHGALSSSGAPAGSTSSSCLRQKRLRCLACTPTPTSSSSCKRHASWWTPCCPYSPAWTWARVRAVPAVLCRHPVRSLPACRCMAGCTEAVLPCIMPKKTACTHELHWAGPGPL